MTRLKVFYWDKSEVAIIQEEIYYEFELIESLIDSASYNDLKAS
jgi:hypothetical protein